MTRHILPYTKGFKGFTSEVSTFEVYDTGCKARDSGCKAVTVKKHMQPYPPHNKAVTGEISTFERILTAAIAAQYRHPVPYKPGTNTAT